MGQSLNAASRDIGTVVDKTLGLPVRLGWETLNALTGKNPLPAMQGHVRSAIGALFRLPFQLTKHVLVGTAKTAGRATWSVCKNLPLLPLPGGR
jgi:hypothetical protein